MPLTVPVPEHGRCLKILLCGYGHLGLSLLQGLLGCSDVCEVVGVFRWSSRPASAHFQEPVETVFRRLVESSGLEDIRCDGINGYAFSALLERLQPDVLLIGSWGEILKPHLLNRPDLLVVNCHPSKLPAHRGANPYSSVIRAGECETGVTFHRVTPQVDAGAILMQETVALNEEDTGASVRDRCSAVASGMVEELVQRLRAHICGQAPLQETEQDYGLQSYFPPLKPEDGLIDWQAEPDAIRRQVRALHPWMPNHTYLQGRYLTLLYDAFVQRRPDLTSGEPQPAGTILAVHQGKLVLALSDPGWVMVAGTYQLAYGNSYWPAWLCRWMARWWFRPGLRFMSGLEPETFG